MHLTKQDFSFKDANDQKAKRLRETNLFLSLMLSCNSDPMVMVQGNLKAPTSLNKPEKGKRESNQNKQITARGVSTSLE